MWSDDFEQWCWDFLYHRYFKSCSPESIRPQPTSDLPFLLLYLTPLHQSTHMLTEYLPGERTELPPILYMVPQQVPGDAHEVLFADLSQPVGVLLPEPTHPFYIYKILTGYLLLQNQLQDHKLYTGSLPAPNRRPTGSLPAPDRRPTGALPAPNRLPTGAQPAPYRRPTGIGIRS